MEEVTDKNDWSFVVKSHALMETAITHVLSEQLHITGSPTHLGKVGQGAYFYPMVPSTHGFPFFPEAVWLK